MDLQEIINSPNLASSMTEEARVRVGQRCWMEFEIDRNSMKEWHDKMKKGIELAKLVKTPKSTPFKDAANVKFPLVTDAAIQFNARTYPAVVHPDGIVKTTTFGQDPGGMKAAAGDRIKNHMDWQFIEEDEEWEEDTDKLLIQLPIVGGMVRKVWQDETEGRKKSRLVEPGCFVVNNRTKSLYGAPRLSEILKLYPDEVVAREKSGIYLHVVKEDDEDSQKPEEYVEQHTRIDLDGDGYGEPYIVTFHRKTQQAVRIVADFDAEDVKQRQDGSISFIKRGSYFIYYEFMPSMDGTFMGTGLGLLLGDISETVNTIINMMIDAGNMASRGGGFLGSEFRMKKSNSQFQPGEWKTSLSTGSMLRDSIVPLTFPGPDATLLQMMGLLIDAAKGTASIKDVLTGDAGTSQMPVGTAMALIEQGLTAYKATYKRIYRSLRKEFKLIAKLNAKYTDPQKYSMISGVQADPRADYALVGLGLRPVADPREVTKIEKMVKGQYVMDMANNGLADKAAASDYMLEAAQIPDRQKFAPKPSLVDMMAMKEQEASLVLVMAKVETEIAKATKMRADALKSVAGADVTTIDGILKRLEATRGELEATLTEVAGGMATASGDNSNPGGFAGQGSGGAGSDIAGLLGGKAIPGGIPSGSPASLRGAG